MSVRNGAQRRGDECEEKWNSPGFPDSLFRCIELSFVAHARRRSNREYRAPVGFDSGYDATDAPPAKNPGSPA